MMMTRGGGGEAVGIKTAPGMRGSCRSLAEPEPKGVERPFSRPFSNLLNYRSFCPGSFDTRPNGKPT